jgi:hypothetical protein
MSNDSASIVAEHEQMRSALQRAGDDERRRATFRANSRIEQQCAGPRAGVASLHIGRAGSSRSRRRPSGVEPLVKGTGTKVSSAGAAR